MSNSFPMPLTEKEEEYYLSLYKNGDMEAKCILIERNLRLVAHIVKKYTGGSGSPGNFGNSISTDDLISIGTIGLIKAINTYNGNKKVRLATYAARCIENELLMQLRSSRKMKSEVSLNEPLGTDRDGNEISFNDILGTDDDFILEDIDTRMQIARLYHAIQDTLSSREKTVILLRYGLGRDRRQTQREVAASLGISRSYVSRIEKKALQKLRKAFTET